MPIEEKVKNKVRLYFITLWVGFLCAVASGALIFYFEEKIEQNNFLVAVLLFILIPAAISHFVLILDLIKTYRFKILFLLILLLRPAWFVAALVCVPYVYMVVLSYKNIPVILRSL